MDCCLCSSNNHFSTARITICPRCYEGAKGMIALLKEEDRSSSSQQSSLGMSETFQRMKELKEEGEDLRQMVACVGRLGAALWQGIPSDIHVQPGTGSPIPAHQVVLAKVSEIFKDMLSSDESKTTAAQDTIDLPEMSHDELECLLEFFYSGTLDPIDRVEKHACSLLVAADMYNIPSLKNFCEAQLLRSLRPSNALQVLVIAETCSNMKLKEHAMSFIARYKDDVLLSAAYDEFPKKHPRLCVEITRALLTDTKLLMDTKDKEDEQCGKIGNSACGSEQQTKLEPSVGSSGSEQQRDTKSEPSNSQSWSRVSRVLGVGSSKTRSTNRPSR